MNREIKFRSWDGVRMFHSFNEYDQQGEIHQLEQFFQQLQIGKDFKDKNYILMQFTGLTDKNGKEVFEDDIVKCSYFKMSVGENLGATEVDAELTGLITFNDLSLCVSNIVGKKWSHYTGFAVGEGSCEYTYLHDVYEGSTECEMGIEVIGNIYENPELLKS